MGFLFQQLIAIKNKLIETLGVFRSDLHEIKKNVETIATTNERNSREKQQQPSGPLMVRFTEDVVRQQQADAERNYRVQNSLKNATWAAFVAASVYGAIAFCQWQIAKNALAETKNEQRPWIGLRQPIGNIVSAARNANSPDLTVSLPLVLQNFGKSPAFNINTNMEIEADPNRFQAIFGSVCGWAEHDAAGKTLPPNGEEPKIRTAIFPGQPYEYSESAAFKPAGSSDFHIFVCIVYVAQGSQGNEWHKTRLGYSAKLQESPPGAPIGVLLVPDLTFTDAD